MRFRDFFNVPMRLHMLPCEIPHKVTSPLESSSDPRAMAGSVLASHMSLSMQTLSLQHDNAAPKMPHPMTRGASVGTVCKLEARRTAKGQRTEEGAAPVVSRSFLASCFKMAIASLGDAIRLRVLGYSPCYMHSPGIRPR